MDKGSETRNFFIPLGPERFERSTESWIMGRDSVPSSTEPCETFFQSNETSSFKRSNPFIAIMATTLICVYNASFGASLRNVTISSFLNA